MNTNIRILIDRYFEGETTAAEEQELRQYFADKDIPQDLKTIAPIFKYMEDESSALKALNEIKNIEKATVSKTIPIYKKIRMMVASAAILLIAIVSAIQIGKDQSSKADSYVWVDGVEITDPIEVEKYAKISFTRIKSNKDIIDEQLKFMLE